ncbi:MAG: peptidylprolyl isomerase [Acidimicrobiia bacterium]
MKKNNKVFIHLSFIVIASFILISCSTIKGELGLDDKAGITYNKLKISEKEMDRDLKSLKENKALEDFLKKSGEPLVKKGKLSDVYVASWANIKMRVLSIREVREDKKVKINKSDKDQALTSAKELFASGQQSESDKIWKGFDKKFQDQVVEDFAEQYALSRAIPSIKDKEIKDYYEKNKSSFSQTCESGKSISHILVKTEKEAKAIKDKLNSGENFAKLAKANSIDPGSKDAGGDLGCYSAGNYVAEFENVAATLEIGKISDIVKTDYGYHILQSNKYETPTLDKLKSQIEEQIKQEKQTALFDKVQTNLKKAKIKVASKYGVLEKKDGYPTIITKAEKKKSSTSTTTSSTSSNT